MSIPISRRGGRRRRPSRAELPRLRTYRRASWDRRRSCWPTPSRTTSRLDKEIAAPLGLCRDARRSGHARSRVRRACSRRCSSSAADFKAQAAYVEPELLHVGVDTLEQFIASEPRLAIYSFYLRDIARRAAHALSDARGKDSRGRDAARGIGTQRLQHPRERRFPVSDDHARATAAPRKVDPSGYAELRTPAESRTTASRRCRRSSRRWARSAARSARR